MKQLFLKKIPLSLITLLTPLFLISQTQIGVDIDGEAKNDFFGHSISLSLDGSIVAVGAPFNSKNGSRSGQVQVFHNTNGSWVQIGSNINGKGTNDFFGYSVSLSSDGSILAIGVARSFYINPVSASNSDYVQIYRNINNNWIQIGSDIKGEVDGDKFGRFVSLSPNGSIVAIGATGNDGNGNDSGHVRVYRNNNGNWIQIGSDINGEVVGDESGSSISLSSDGSIVAIGAPLNDGVNGQNSGHVRVYRNTNNNWVQIGSDIDGKEAGDLFGRSISLSSAGNIIAIGAAENDVNGISSGHVRVYKNTNDNWVQIGNDINGENEVDYFGRSLSLSSNGSIVAISAYFYDGVNGLNSGHVQIYRNNNAVWEQVGNTINGAAKGDEFGTSVSLSSNSNVVAIGARRNNQAGSSRGQVRVYNLSTVLKNTDFLLSKFSVFPNPVKKSFIIQLKENIKLKKVSIYNSFGQFIKSSKELSINTSNLTKGMYVLKIETNKGTASKKLVIE
jgi:hypothetical protein